MLRSQWVWFVVGGLGLLSVLAVANAPSSLRVGHFSEEAPGSSPPAGWKPIRFGENEASTDYSLVRTDSVVVLRAESENAASGLITTEPRVDLTKYPVLEWRWKVDQFPDRADVGVDTTDDAGARLYVTFDYDGLGLLDRFKLMLLRQVTFSEAPSRALNYVWATRTGQKQMQPSPYTDQIMMLPIRGGGARQGEWVRERRNVLADYRAAYGEAPPPVNGIAVMTDTDNTGGTATAFYGDIVFRDTTMTTGG